MPSKQRRKLSSVVIITITTAISLLAIINYTSNHSAPIASAHDTFTRDLLLVVATWKGSHIVRVSPSQRRLRLLATLPVRAGDMRPAEARVGLFYWTNDAIPIEHYGNHYVLQLSTGSLHESPLTTLSKEQCLVRWAMLDGQFFVALSKNGALWWWDASSGWYEAGPGGLSEIIAVEPLGVWARLADGSIGLITGSGSVVQRLIRPEDPQSEILDDRRLVGGDGISIVRTINTFLLIDFNTGSRYNLRIPGTLESAKVVDHHTVALIGGKGKRSELNLTQFRSARSSVVIRSCNGACVGSVSADPLASYGSLEAEAAVMGELRWQW